ncbi:DUF2590 family protein [Klebsiella pneumoniae]|uniref:DUF2590 family protein n=1 Tax=Klebsiella TaxID=570 RepID=UPI00081C1B82|nr:MULTISPECIES: DUF2590 family protein [Klebsiella]HDS7231419.1 DUF2590 family protein [Klebsiella pneumoniae subsp. pneumoniae]EKV8550914.1 DUF2590 family protein [Klebsiella pneumoniae]MBC4875570.1 DUF2590 family protein [Klebsiella pneumoniae]MCA5290509.1 DUF2590 family protein [Klebsiella pneumoniae]MCA5301008.1 DUF2590 family protein [Klebsiella pneumoniae]
MNDEKQLYFDLKITAGNFTLDYAGEPGLCNNRNSIAQDVVHMIIESELSKNLVAERSPTLRYDIAQQLEQLVETDERLVPGTATIEETGAGTWLITADTWEFGPLASEMTL